jgi:hypothetical protein
VLRALARADRPVAIRPVSHGSRRPELDLSSQECRCTRRIVRLFDTLAVSCRHVLEPITLSDTHNLRLLQPYLAESRVEPGSAGKLEALAVWKHRCVFDQFLDEVSAFLLRCEGSSATCSRRRIQGMSRKHRRPAAQQAARTMPIVKAVGQYFTSTVCRP